MCFQMMEGARLPRHRLRLGCRSIKTEERRKQQERGAQQKQQQEASAQALRTTTTSSTDRSQGH